MFLSPDVRAQRDAFLTKSGWKRHGLSKSSWWKKDGELVQANVLYARLTADLESHKEEIAAEKARIAAEEEKRRVPTSGDIELQSTVAALVFTAAFGPSGYATHQDGHEASLFYRDDGQKVVRLSVRRDGEHVRYWIVPPASVRLPLTSPLR